MVGLGCEPPSGFRSGFHSNGGDQHWFRALSHVTAKPDVVEKELRALKLHGLRFSRISVPSAKTGQPGSGLYVEIIDYDDWQPTELDFWLLKLACKLEPKNPFATAKLDSKSLFVRLVGSTAFVNDLVAKGKNIDVEAWLRTWREQARIYQQQSKRFWLYH